jgi:hypothetical protein
VHESHEEAEIDEIVEYEMTTKNQHVYEYSRVHAFEAKKEGVSAKSVFSILPLRFSDVRILYIWCICHIYTCPMTGGESNESVSEFKAYCHEGYLSTPSTSLSYLALCRWNWR